MKNETVLLEFLGRHFFGEFGNSDGLAHPHLITIKSTWTLLNESLVFKELNKTFNQERF